MPVSRSSNPSRAALAARLARLREETGLSGNAFAGQLGMVQSRVWKIEHGELLPTEDDIRAWVPAAGGNDEIAAELIDLLNQARVKYTTYRAAFRRRGAAGQQAVYTKLEAQSSRIGNFSVGMIPGLVQTADYAREILSLPCGPAAHGASPGDIEEILNERLRRQEALYDQSKQIQFVLPEAALRTLLSTPATLAGQLQKLLAVAALPSVELGVIGFHQHIPIYTLTAFELLDDAVIIEHLTGEQRIDEPDKVAWWARCFDMLREAASTGPDAEAIIQRALDDLAG